MQNNNTLKATGQHKIKGACCPSSSGKNIMQIIHQNILAVMEGVIGHQVNTKGVMGAGLASQIKTKYPAVWHAYSQNTPLLGTCQLVQVTETLFVANLAAQSTYGRWGQHTNYDALTSSLQNLQQQRGSKPCYLPYGLGCGLAGGDWDIVSKIIQDTIPDAILVKIIAKLN